MCTPSFKFTFSVYVHVYMRACMCTSCMVWTQYSKYNRQVLCPKHINPAIIHSRVHCAVTRLNWILQHIYILYVCTCSSVHMWVSTCTHVKPGINVRDLPWLYSTLCLETGSSNKPGTHQFGNTSWQASSRGPPYSSPLVLVPQV